MHFGALCVGEYLYPASGRVSQDNHKFHANLGYRVKFQDNGGSIVSATKPRGKMELKAISGI